MKLNHDTCNTDGLKQAAWGSITYTHSFLCIINYNLFETHPKEKKDTETQSDFSTEHETCALRVNSPVAAAASFQETNGKAHIQIHSIRPSSC